jgi:hypothetical protein
MIKLPLVIVESLRDLPSLLCLPGRALNGGSLSNTERMGTAGLGRQGIRKVAEP